MTEPSLLRAVICALAAVACLVAAAYGRSLPEWLKTLLAASGFVLLVFSLLMAWDWLSPRLADADLARREAAATTEAVFLAREIRQMTSEQIAAFVAVYPAMPVESDEPTRVILTSEDGLHSRYIDIPASEEELITIAQGLQAGAPFTLAALTGRGRLLSRAQFEALRGYFLENGLMRWVNEDAPAQGVALTASGSDLMAHYAALPHREKA